MITTEILSFTLSFVAKDSGKIISLGRITINNNCCKFGNEGRTWQEEISFKSSSLTRRATRQEVPVLAVYLKKSEHVIYNFRPLVTGRIEIISPRISGGMPSGNVTLGTISGDEVETFIKQKFLEHGIEDNGCMH